MWNLVPFADDRFESCHGPHAFTRRWAAYQKHLRKLVIGSRCLDNDPWFEVLGGQLVRKRAQEIWAWILHY